MNASIKFLEEYRKKEFHSNDLPPAITMKYKVISCLKYTTDKQVFLIRGKLDGKKYIIKCVDEKSHENLEEEYELHHSLTHVGLVPAVEYIKVEQYSYFIREYVEGYTITELVEMSKDGHLSDVEAVQLTLQLCDILKYLHSLTPPVIHRDIKPDNIIFTKQEECKLIDFGISRRFHDDREKDTFVMGTEYTAPPEQFGYKQTDARSDIYSIGILVFYMVTGSLDIKDINSFAISSNIKKIIQKCTEFSPEDRFGSVKQLEMKLARYDYHISKKKMISGGIFAIVIICSIISIFGYTLIHNRNKEQLNEIQVTTMNQENNSDTLAEGETFVFSSPLIEAAVRQELGKGEADLITLSDLENVEELYLCGEQIYEEWNNHFVYGKSQYMTVAEYNQKGIFKNQGIITSLDDLRQMKNLHILALYNQNISDLSSLKDLNNLTRLGLGANNISNISAITELTNLKTLDLSGNPIGNDNLKSIIQLSSLEELDLGETGVTDVSTLKELKLRSLSLYADKVMDCEGLATLSSLEKLIITGVGNGITEVGLSNIVKLSNLKELRLMGGEIKASFDITQLSNLTYLDLCAGKIETWEGLKGLHLTTLLIDYSTVTDLEPLIQFKELISVSLVDIVCEDYTPLTQLPKLQNINCSEEQAKIIKEQLGEQSYDLWIQ